MSNGRDNIPSEVKRQLRQEAGFGCCRCGHPIYEYHHIVPYSEENHNRPDDMMLLCPNCHHMATVGALLEKQQRQIKVNPHNICKGLVRGALVINEEAPVVSLGSIQLVGDGALINVDGEPLLSLTCGKDGLLELSVILYDQNDNLIASISRNEWQTGDRLPWDFEGSHQRIQIRQKHRDISLTINAKRMPIQIRGKLWYRGQRIKITKEWLRIDGVIQDFRMADLCLLAMQICINTPSQRAALTPDPRFKNAVIVSEADVSKRVQKGLEKWKNLLATSSREGLTRDDPLT